MPPETVVALRVVGVAGGGTAEREGATEGLVEVVGKASG